MIWFDLHLFLLDVENVPQVKEDVITTRNVKNEGESAIQGASQETSPIVGNVQLLRRSERICCVTDRLNL